MVGLTKSLLFTKPFCPWVYYPLCPWTLWYVIGEQNTPFLDCNAPEIIPSGLQFDYLMRCYVARSLSIDWLMHRRVQATSFVPMGIDIILTSSSQYFWLLVNGIFWPIWRGATRDRALSQRASSWYSLDNLLVLDSFVDIHFGLGYISGLLLG